MLLRAPAVPLITIDPFISIWSPNEVINYKPTIHWTRSNMSIIGYVNVDGVEYSFLGFNRNAKKMTQTEMDITTLSTLCTFECEKIKLYVRFMTPMLPDDLDVLTRPVSYMSVRYEKKCDCVKNVSIRVVADNSVCLDKINTAECDTFPVELDGVTGIRMGNRTQNVLNRSGDDHKIDWGYFYLCTKGEGTATGITNANNPKDVKISLTAPIAEGEEKLVLFAYDDIASINYFGKHLKSYWNRNGKTIDTAILEAVADYDVLKDKCDDFSDKMCSDAYMAGGEKYADLVCLAYRQVMAAHKVAVDDNGDILYISKECNSNGCAATVDVSYPSIPLFLYYNTELLKGMLRPIYKFAASDAWTYDYAPHDAGRYPLVTGQVYGLREGVLLHEKQMPVEECGNMIIMETNIAIADGNAEFARPNMDVLRGWCEYLIKYGDDPENQLCTDDFAGHLAHNCNLTLKAIMGIAGMSILSDMLGLKDDAEKYMAIAKEKAASWVERAKNPDGRSYRLAFDRPGSFSMKYNMVWDKIWGTGIFPKETVESEIASNIETFNRYGMPLDSRADYTKSDWLVWVATMARTKADFKKFVAPLWKFYNETPDRVPMSDWFDTKSGYFIAFIHRTVQGGLFIKMLDESGKLKLKK